MISPSAMGRKLACRNPSCKQHLESRASPGQTHDPCGFTRQSCRDCSQLSSTLHVPDRNGNDKPLILLGLHGRNGFSRGPGGNAEGAVAWIRPVALRPGRRRSPLCQTSCRVFRTAERGGAGDREWHDTDKHSGTASSRGCCRRRARPSTWSRARSGSASARWSAGGPQALAAPGELASSQRWTPAARLEAVITTAAMDEAARSAWCREQGLYPAELEAWKQRRHRRPGRAAGGERRRGPAGPAAGEGARARAAPQGQGAGRDGRLAGARKKTGGDLPRRRGRMTRLEDRQTLLPTIAEACAAGARLAPACALAGIDLRTFQRWRAGDGQVARRPPARRRPAQAVARPERGRAGAHRRSSPTSRASPSTPPARIVPALADEGSLRRQRGQLPSRAARPRPDAAPRPGPPAADARPAQHACGDRARGRSGAGT